MTDEILEEYILQHIEASTESVINFSWHGGEPLMAGIDFFRKVLKFQSSHKPEGKTIVNGIQTNGTLLNDEWCRFFAREGFVIGLSLDGPSELHDINRRTKDGMKTWQKVIDGFILLEKNNILPEVLCVVNAENVKQPLVVYRFLRELGAKYMTFLPLVERESGSSTGAGKSSVGSEDFGFFLSDIFDEWVENDIGEIKIQIFEEAARTAFNQEHTLCVFRENCGGVPVVEHNGDFYSCDHYVNSDNLLGNIKDHSLSYFLDSRRQKTFGLIKSATLPDYCKLCEVRSMCNGECPKNRFVVTPDGQAGLNYLCKGYRYFFNHIRPFVEAISDVWKDQERHPPAGG